MAKSRNSQGSLNPHVLAPIEVEHGDILAYKFVAVVQDDFWSVFKGFSDWSDIRVSQEGDRVFDKEFCEKMFYALANSDKQFYA